MERNGQEKINGQLDRVEAETTSSRKVLNQVTESLHRLNKLLAPLKSTGVKGKLASIQRRIKT